MHQTNLFYTTAMDRTRVKNKPWTMNALFCMLDRARKNYRTLYNDVNKMKKSSFKCKNTFDFTWDLGKALALPWMREVLKAHIWTVKWRQSKYASCSQDSRSPTCTSSLCCKSAHWK